MLARLGLMTGQTMSISFIFHTNCRLILILSFNQQHRHRHRLALTLIGSVTITCRKLFELKKYTENYLQMENARQPFLFLPPLKRQRIQNMKVFHRESYNLLIRDNPENYTKKEENCCLKKINLQCQDLQKSQISFGEPMFFFNFFQGQKARLWLQ